jgi:hypothetical protein
MSAFIAITLRRQDDVDDARVTKNETLVRRGKKWFRYDAPDKRLFKQLQKTLTAPDLGSVWLITERISRPDEAHQ